MFKRKASGSKPVSEPPALDSDKAEKTASPASEKQPAAAPAPADGAPGRAHARRADGSVAAAAARRPEFRQSVPSAAKSGGGDDRKLVVGQGIRLSGEIKKCEKLVVEGEVEADLKDCVSLEIAPEGQFNGAAVVEDAEISGRFDGELTVNGRLLLRSSGRINGQIRYTDLEIERGGKIAGSVDMLDGSAESEGANAAAPMVAQAEAGEAAAPKSKPKEEAAAPKGNGSEGQLDLEAEAAAKPNGSDNAAEAARESEKPSLPL